jgi:transglutaminase-like putative cysteine protease
MNRRDFLQLSAMAACSGLSGIASATTSEPASDGWHTYEVTTMVQVRTVQGGTHIWLPAPLPGPTPFQRTLSTSIQCETGKVRRVRDGSLSMVCATFRAGTTPAITMTNRIATRDWAISPEQPHISTSRRRPEAYLAPTRYVPTDGIVKARADSITKGLTSDLDKTRAVYEWVVENTYRNPKVRGCGVGDIRPMLETGDLGGKCADINALFVGLVKASGVPARDVYGIRVGPSELSCKSLGAASDNITKSQHCRAEVYLDGFGWVPMDPADVRKVILEEPPGSLTLNDIKVVETRKRLFGSWEGNWIAYNYAQDISLPGSSGPALHFLMYPQAETADGRLDCLSPDDFRYKINTRTITA